MGYAAISATLDQVQAARAYMVRQTTERAAVKDCLDKVGNSVDSLRQAAQLFDEMRGAKDDQRNNHRENVMKHINSSGNDQNSCSDFLKKHKQRIGGEIIEEAERQAAHASIVGQVLP